MVAYTAASPLPSSSLTRATALFVALGALAACSSAGEGALASDGSENGPGTNPGDAVNAPGDVTNPGNDPAAPGTNPSNPGTDPTDPGTDPSNPSTNPGDPGPGPVFTGFDQTITGGGEASGFHTFEMTLDGEGYNVQTNPWRTGTQQTITAGGDFVFRVDSLQEPAGLESWDVATFPSVYKGVAQGDQPPTPDSGLPTQLKNISSIAAGLSTNSSSINFKGNATYDVYLTKDSQWGSGGPDVFMMVWFDANNFNPINGDDEGWNCGGDPPTYVDSCSDAGSLVVGGLTFHRFIGGGFNTSTVISYVPETTMDEWEFDMKEFLDDAVSEGVASEDQYLQSIQAGFELVTGGVGLTVNGFYADVR